MGQADDMSKFVKNHALNIGDRVPVRAKPKVAPIRIPLLSRIEENVCLGHPRSGISVVSDGQCVSAETLAEHRVCKHHRVNTVSRCYSGSRIHDLAELDMPENLIPHPNRRRGRNVPGRIAIGKRTPGSAEFELHGGTGPGGPQRTFQGIGASILRRQGQRKGGKKESGGKKARKEGHIFQGNHKSNIRAHAAHADIFL